MKPRGGQVSKYNNDTTSVHTTPPPQPPSTHTINCAISLSSKNNATFVMTSLNDKGENHFNSVIAPDLQHVEKQLFFVKLKPKAGLPLKLAVMEDFAIPPPNMRLFWHT